MSHDEYLRLLRLELLAVAIADKVGVDVGPINEEIQRVRVRREERRLHELALEEDEIARRNKIALTAAIRSMPPINLSVPAVIVPKPAPADPHRPRA